MTATISESYRELQRKLHENPDYGVASEGFAPIVATLIAKERISELLDYGAGKCRLKVALQSLGIEVDYYAFDPARDDICDPPEPRQMVACIDVLEHIEPEYLDAALDDLQRVTLQLGFFSIHTQPAQKVLPDGRNAHLIQESYRWWLPKLWARFELAMMQETSKGFFVLVGPKV